MRIVEILIGVAVLLLVLGAGWSIYRSRTGQDGGKGSKRGKSSSSSSTEESSSGGMSRSRGSGTGDPRDERGSASDGGGGSWMYKFLDGMTRVLNGRGAAG